MNRRDFLGAAAGAGAIVAGGRLLPTADPVGSRFIGEMLPALGLGTFLTFDLLPGRDRSPLRAVLRCYVEAGVRVIDTSPLYGSSEASVGQFIGELGVGDRLFLADKVWSTGEYLADESHARRSLEQSQLRLWREQLDLLQIHSLTNIESMLPIAQIWKKEGRIRYVGLTHYLNEYHDAIVGLIERNRVDFVQVNYSIANRAAEQTVLRAAAARGVGVLVNMPLEKGRLHKIVEGRPLPDFARDIGVANWAQFFLKWAMGHPAVTTVLSATANPEHAAENVGALKGPLPDAAFRDRMVRHMEAIPEFASVGQLPWYPDKQAMYQGLIRRAQSEQRRL